MVFHKKNMSKLIIVIITYLFSLLLVVSILAGVDLVETGCYEISSLYHDLKISIISTAIPSAIGIYRIYRKK
jgi:hypothetical protein